MRELRPRIEKVWQGDGAAMIIILPGGDVAHRSFFFHGARVPRVTSNQPPDIKYDENDLWAWKVFWDFPL